MKPVFFTSLWFKACVVALSLALFCPSASSAEYNGEDIDGNMYDATAYSYSTAAYYDVQVEFQGDEGTIYFSNGGHIVLTLDNEEIDDPHNISAYDYQQDVYWDIDVDGLD